MEAATEGGDLLRALQEVRGREGGGNKKLHKNVQLWTVARCEGKGPAIDQPAGVTFYLLSGHIYDCARVRLRLRHRGGSKKNKIKKKSKKSFALIWSIFRLL